MIATVLDCFDPYYVDIYSREKDNICNAYKNNSVYTKNLAAGIKCICTTLSLYNPGIGFIDFCDIPLDDDFNMTPPKGHEDDAGITGLQIAEHFLSKCEN